MAKVMAAVGLGKDEKKTGREDEKLAIEAMVAARAGLLDKLKNFKLGMGDFDYDHFSDLEATFDLLLSHNPSSSSPNATSQLLLDRKLVLEVLVATAMGLKEPINKGRFQRNSFYSEFVNHRGKAIEILIKIARPEEFATLISLICASLYHEERIAAFQLLEEQLAKVSKTSSKWAINQQIVISEKEVIDNIAAVLQNCTLETLQLLPISSENKQSIFEAMLKELVIGLNKELVDDRPGLLSDYERKSFLDRTRGLSLERLVEMLTMTAHLSANEGLMKESMEAVAHYLVNQGLGYLDLFINHSPKIKLRANIQMIVTRIFLDKLRSKTINNQNEILDLLDCLICFSQDPSVKAYVEKELFNLLDFNSSSGMQFDMARFDCTAEGIVQKRATDRKVMNDALCREVMRDRDVERLDAKLSMDVSLPPRNDAKLSAEMHLSRDVIAFLDMYGRITPSDLVSTDKLRAKLYQIPNLGVTAAFIEYLRIIELTPDQCKVCIDVFTNTLESPNSIGRGYDQVKFEMIDFFNDKNLKSKDQYKVCIDAFISTLSSPDFSMKPTPDVTLDIFTSISERIERFKREIEHFFKDRILTDDEMKITLDSLSNAVRQKGKSTSTDLSWLTVVIEALPIEPIHYKMFLQFILMLEPEEGFELDAALLKIERGAFESKLIDEASMVKIVKRLLLTNLRTYKSEVSGREVTYYFSLEHNVNVLELLTSLPIPEACADDLRNSLISDLREPRRTLESRYTYESKERTFPYAVAETFKEQIKVTLQLLAKFPIPPCDMPRVVEAIAPLLFTNIPAQGDLKICVLKFLAKVLQLPLQTRAPVTINARDTNAMAMTVASAGYASPARFDVKDGDEKRRTEAAQVSSAASLSGTLMSASKDEIRIVWNQLKGLNILHWKMLVALDPLKEMQLERIISYRLGQAVDALWNKFSPTVEEDHFERERKEERDAPDALVFSTAASAASGAAAAVEKVAGVAEVAAADQPVAIPAPGPGPAAAAAAPVSASAEPAVSAIAAMSM